MDKYIGKYIGLLIALFFLHTIGVYVPFLGIIIGCVEMMVLCTMIIKNDFRRFLIFMTFILSTSFEIPTFVYGDSTKIVYSCTKLPVVQGYAFLLVLYFPFFANIKNIIKSRSVSGKKYVLLDRTKFFMCVFLLQGFLFGLISILINDNNIRNISYVSYFFRDAIAICAPIVFMLYFVYALKKIDGFSTFVSNFIISFIISANIVALVLTLLGLHGFYGDNPTVQMPLSFIFSTSVFFFLSERCNRRTKLLLFFAGVISIFLQIFYYNALGGKSWIILLMALLYLTIKMWKRYKTQTTLIIIVFSFVFGASIFMSFETYKAENEKLNQAFLLMTAFSSDAYDKIPSSPKMRLEEFFNIVREYNDKPYFILGKGFGGSIKDYSGGFGYYEEGAFQKDEYDNNSFIMVHETLNVLLLKFGIVGLFFLFIILKEIFKYSKKYPFLLMGLIWVAFFFNYSLSIALVGIPALLLGIYEVDKEKFSFNEREYYC